MILEETHPLKKLQEETLEIEREMKYFRRMLQRDIQKYQEVTGYLYIFFTHLIGETSLNNLKNSQYIY